MDTLDVPQGRFVLTRYPVRRNEQLRAWDAADEFVLRFLADQLRPGRAAGSTVIVNDGWGALTVALATHQPVSLSDSFVSHRATRENLMVNSAVATDVTCVASRGPLSTPIATLVVKVPRSLALLEDQLCHVAPHVTADTIVVAGAMTKNIHTSTIELFERILGPTRTSLAEKKARLIICSPDPDRIAAVSPWPCSFTLDGGQQVISHAGVFSAERLDPGTRFLLEKLRVGVGPQQVVDLGCGNGILGLLSAIQNPEAEVTFVDESYLAIASAEATFRVNLGPDRAARFTVGNGLFDAADGDGLAFDTVDRVLCNPPFHIDNALGDATAWQMFSASRQALRIGGELWVVGNRHLAYHAKLKRIFGHCDVVAGNAKFVVLRAVRRETRRTQAPADLHDDDDVHDG